MIRRFYVHNFRCLENFDLPIAMKHSSLLIGRNGAGKSAVGAALEVLQRVARGTTRVGDLVKPKDLTQGRSDLPMRFEMEVELAQRIYHYTLALELPSTFKELRVHQEDLTVDSEPIYTRKAAQVRLARANRDPEAAFSIDWHLVALPIVQPRPKQPESDPLFLFKQWLSRVLILRPIPALMSGESHEDAFVPEPAVGNFGDWFAGLLAETPSAYETIASYLKQLFPDFKDIQNRTIGKDARTLIVNFGSSERLVELPFADLSDGEKCFFVCALVLAAAYRNESQLCFWDEPDNYLALDEVSHFVTALRQRFSGGGGQFIATSHNPETIRRFAEDNTIVLQRKSHLEPTVARLLSDLQIKGDLLSAIARGDLNS